jgi:uncharacterized protein YigE (DUF2233 family)
MLRPAITTLLLVLGTAGIAKAVECHSMKAPFDARVCLVDAAKEHLELRLNGPDRRPLKSFAALIRMAGSEGKTVEFAMNAGMFERNYAPVGLLIEDGRISSPLNRKVGLGNFYLRPNVDLSDMWSTDDGAAA